MVKNEIKRSVIVPCCLSAILPAATVIRPDWPTARPPDCLRRSPVPRLSGSVGDRSRLGEEDLDGVYRSSGPLATAVAEAVNDPERRLGPEGHQRMSSRAQRPP
jgi:hypothetical protein